MNHQEKLSEIIFNADYLCIDCKDDCELTFKNHITNNHACVLCCSVPAYLVEKEED
jgi:hypothetical protein